MKAGLSLACLALGTTLAAAVAAAEPAQADAAAPAAPEAAEPGASEAEPGVSEAEPGASEAEPALEKTSSELSASTRDEYSPEQDRGGSEHADEDFGHGMQFGLRANITGGYRMVFRYDKSPFCRQPDPAKADKDQQKFCGHAAPFATDVALSFAIVDFAEPYLWARFGLGGEAETNTEALTAFGVGARIYTMSDSKFKIFVEPALAMETESGAGNDAWHFNRGTALESAPDYKTDFLFHLAVGPQYDFARAFGMYLDAGITTGVLRYIHTELEVSLGAQVRVP